MTFIVRVAVLDAFYARQNIARDLPQHARSEASTAS